VYKYINWNSPPKYHLKKKRVSKLDAYKEFIRNKLNEHTYTAVRLYKMIKQHGYDGKLTIVQDFIKNFGKQI
jgi:transposase